jgi:hypothetical protein
MSGTRCVEPEKVMILSKQNAALFEAEGGLPFVG